jgi:transcriptional regulator GlxA family with amidase domain
MSPDVSLVEKAERLLNRFITDPKALAEMDCNKLALYYGVDERTMRNHFTDCKWRSPALMIKEKKLLCAVILISGDPARSVKEIAEKVGFFSHKYFSKEFKKQFGFYPSQLKQWLVAQF